VDLERNFLTSDYSTYNELIIKLTDKSAKQLLARGIINLYFHTFRGTILQCDYIISDDDIKEIYDSVTSYNLESKPWGVRCDDKNSKNIKIDLKIDDDELTHLDIPIRREFFHSKSLYNQDSCGKVAEHIIFRINEKYRKQGIAKAIHESELKIYKRNSFQQIQLNASFEGVLVWSKLFYKYKDEDDEQEILMELWTYLKQVHLLSLDVLSSKMFKKKNLKDINIKYFLAPSKYQDSFAEWLTKRPNRLIIDMYKDIK